MTMFWIFTIHLELVFISEVEISRRYRKLFMR